MLGVRFLVRAFNSGVSKPPLYGGGEGFVFLLEYTITVAHSSAKIT